MLPIDPSSVRRWRARAGGALRSAQAWLPALAAAFLLAGCATGDVVMLAEISGGEKIRVPLGRGGPELKNEDGVQIHTATLTLGAEKKIVHVFEFTDTRQRPLRRVQVEDVSDAAPLPFIDDSQPQPGPNGRWRGDAPPVDLTDPRLHWMATISNTLRVYRFTITFADSRTLVLHQAALYPAPLKSAIRQTLGQNY